MKQFHHTEHPLRVYSGDDSLGALEQELARQGIARAMIFTGRTLAGSALLDQVRGSAGSRCTGIYDGVRTHTPRDAVEEASDALRRAGADAILVLGGGSATVSARAAVIFHGEGHDLDAMCTRRRADGTVLSPRLLRPKIPLIVIPTTPNTAYVKAGAGVFDPAAGERKAIFDPQTRARSIFLHPDFLMSAPSDLVVSCCLDTLVLALEGLIGERGDAISDALLMQALRLLWSALPRLRDADDPDLRLDLTLSGILSGRGTDHAPAGATTALGHALGANHDVANGVAKAILLPHVLRFNGDRATAGLTKVAAALGIAAGTDPLERVTAEIGRLFQSLDLPVTLNALGLSVRAHPDIAVRAMKDWFILGNVRPVRSATELEAILGAAQA